MEQASEGDALEIQRVEVFERQGSDAPWQPVGEGTVLWQAGAEGRVEQRLLVMQPDEAGEWARELEALDFPDPNVAINCLPDDSVLTWRRGGATREVALAFRSQEGCLQVWEDVQALQELTFGDGSGDASMSEYLDQFADLYGGAGGGAGGGPLPPPSEERLSEVAMRLSTCPPGLMPLLLQQLIGAEAAAAAMSNYAHAMGGGGGAAAAAAAAATAAAERGGGEEDYIAQLSAISKRLSEDGGSSEGGDGASPSKQGKGSAEWKEARRAQLAGIFKGLLTMAGDEPVLLQRMLQPDALYALLRCLEAEDSKHHTQTEHVNVQHVAFLSDARRFRTPVPIRDEATLVKIHQNFAISYLTDAALPLALEPGTLGRAGRAAAEQRQGHRGVAHVGRALHSDAL